MPTRSIPCINCITMAICNAIMHQPEKKFGMNAFQVYKRCPLIKQHIEEHWTIQENITTWRVSLKPIQVFFVDEIKDTYFITDDPDQLS